MCNGTKGSDKIRSESPILFRAYCLKEGDIGSLLLKNVIVWVFYKYVWITG